MKFLCSLQLDLSRLNLSPDSTPNLARFTDFLWVFCFISCLNPLCTKLLQMFSKNNTWDHVPREKKDRKTYELLMPPFFTPDYRIRQVLTVKTVKFCASASGKRSAVRYVSVLCSVVHRTTFCGHHVHVHVQLYVYAHVYGYVTRCRTSLIHRIGGQILLDPPDQLNIGAKL